jgi:hypothetical protein
MLTVIVDGELKVLSVRRKTKGEYKLKVLFRSGGGREASRLSLRVWVFPLNL